MGVLKFIVFSMVSFRNNQFYKPDMYPFFTFFYHRNHTISFTFVWDKSLLVMDNFKIFNEYKLTFECKVEILLLVQNLQIYICTKINCFSLLSAQFEFLNKGSHLKSGIVSSDISF